MIVRLKILLLLFNFFGLYVALPLIVWDIASRYLYAPLAVILTILAMFVPTAVIAIMNMKPDADDEEVPFRMDQEASVRATLITGPVLGVAAVVWLIL